MSISRQDPVVDEDDYDEEADSDFDEVLSDAGSASSSEQDDTAKPVKKPSVTTKKPLVEELDSGDEATIKERKKSKKKQKRRDGQVSSDDEVSEAWRAKTRSMRANEQEEKQKRKVVDIKSSTVDVNRIWEELQRPGPLPPIRIEGEQEIESPTKKQEAAAPVEEMITIKRQFKFAGEVHVEDKTVPKSSAEARLWLSQQENKNKEPPEATESGRQRPLRKISRFDPNYSNLDSFKNHLIKVQPDAFKGPKLNVVEKSKMDWASHVDAEGLKHELDVAAKAKGAYLNRMDFLGEVEQRKEEEARLARQKG